MAYRNLQQLAHYKLPFFPRELGKQLTAMVLAQVVVDCFATRPFTIINAIQLNTALNSDPFIKAQIQLIYRVTLAMPSLYFSVKFYFLYNFRIHYIYIYIYPFVDQNDFVVN